MLLINTFLCKTEQSKCNNIKANCLFSVCELQGLLTVYIKETMNHISCTILWKDFIKRFSYHDSSLGHFLILCCWLKTLRELWLVTTIVVIRRREVKDEIRYVVSSESWRGLTLEMSTSLSFHGWNLTLIGIGVSEAKILVLQSLSSKRFTGKCDILQS